jgi:NAD(P) transhydrogenase subunit alpha
MSLLTELAILLLAAFVGFQVISKVPNTLHTPLMSGTNAIHGIVLLGGLVGIAHAEGTLEKLILVIAIAFGTINVVGGFLVTDRMLSMFKRRPEPPKADVEEAKPPTEVAAPADSEPPAETEPPTESKPPPKPA